MKRCSNCGAAMNDEDMFCPTCGKPYENAYAAQTQQNNTTAQGAQREPYVPIGESERHSPLRFAQLYLLY